jgi:PAS domain S-box-containing protein
MMTPELPSLPFPAALLRDGQPVAGAPWLVELLSDDDAVWMAADGHGRMTSETLPWRRPEPWHGALTVRTALGTRHVQLAGARFDADHWLWQLVEEEPTAAQARAIVRAISALPDTLTVSTAELISAAAEWTAVVDSLPQMIILTGLDGRITRCNEAFRRFIGLPFGNLVGRLLAQVLAGADAPPLSDEYYASATSAVLCPRAGLLLVRGFPIRRNSQLRGWVHGLEDISAARLLDSGHRPLVSAEQSADGIALVDAKLRVDYANPALATLLGTTRQDLLRRGVGELHLLPEASSEEALALTLRSGQRTMRSELVLGGQQRVVEISIGPVESPGGEVAGFVLVARDITERERELRNAEAAVATGDLCHWLGGLRHELGNPVNSVKMALTVLHSHLSEFTPEEVTRYVERALSELGRVEYLLKSLKTFTMFDPPELQRVDVASFIERTVASLEPALARQGIAIEVIPSDAPLIATADPRALQQVAMSLVSNAAEAFNGGEGKIQIGAERAGGAIELNVRDSGPGIAPAQLERLFLPFASTKRGSPGLGLTLVRQLVTAMRGTVSIESALGAGTRVRVRLDEVR